MPNTVRVFFTVGPEKYRWYYNYSWSLTFPTYVSKYLCEKVSRFEITHTTGTRIPTRVALLALPLDSKLASKDLRLYVNDLYTPWWDGDHLRTSHPDQLSVVILRCNEYWHLLLGKKGCNIRNTTWWNLTTWCLMYLRPLFVPGLCHCQWISLA